ncbi:putative 4-hydroxybenzoate polyprenyltransferase [Rubripirellula amarantea]|nr:4-hydroxybenzoate octaprenyltransferase [Rubripirellula amarantea]MDA8743454.1 putative 4-hydroxybenzoate polyprenyltransferase [Rubripirellula amarantea]
MSSGSKPSPPRASEPSRKFARIGHWLGLIRFSHTIFALPFACLACVMAFHTPLESGEMPLLRWRDLVGVLLCMVFARSAAMAFNRLVDRDIDGRNPRTVGRHLPAGVLTVRQVRVFTVICCLGFVASTAIFLPNPIPLIASLPVLLFLLGYSLAKRFTSAAHLWLGVALSLSPIGTWLAIRGGNAIALPSDLYPPIMLAVAVAAWVTGFDIIYSCQDAKFDRDVGLNSVPARFGIEGALKIAAISHVVMLIALVGLLVVGQACGLGWIFAVALVGVAGLVIRQHRLVSPDDLDRVNQAFFDTNAIISVTLLIAGSLDCWW